MHTLWDGPLISIHLSLPSVPCAAQHSIPCIRICTMNQAYILMPKRVDDREQSMVVEKIENDARFAIH